MRRELPLLLLVSLALMIAAATACADRERSDDATRVSGNVAPILTQRSDSLLDTDGSSLTSSYFWLAIQRSGRALLLDQDDKRVVQFDSGGAIAHTAMRRGAGPGEAQFPTALFLLPADSVAVWDATLRRVAVFDSILHYARTEVFVNWNFANGRLEPVGRFADGRWLALAKVSAVPGTPPVGIRDDVDTMRLMIGTSRQAPTRFVDLAIRRGVDVTLPMNGGGVNIYKLRARDFHLGTGAVCDSGVVLVDEAGIRTINARGTTLTHVPLPVAADTLRGAALEQALSFLLWPPVDTSRYAAPARASLRRDIDGAPVRYRKPDIDLIGNLWFDSARSFARVRSLERFDEQQRVVARLLMPANMSDIRVGVRRIVASTNSVDDGRTARMHHLASPVVDLTRARFGVCSPAFEY